MRLEGAGDGRWDVRAAPTGSAELREADEARRPDAMLRADAETWARLSDDLRRRHGRVPRRAADRPPRPAPRRRLPRRDERRDRAESALRFRHVETAHRRRSSTMQAGEGPPVVLLHGLGATKASFLPTLAALAPAHRVIAIDLPGFGDSVKPVGARVRRGVLRRAGRRAARRARARARATWSATAWAGASRSRSASGTRSASARLVLLAPSLAWLRDRPWAPLLRLVPPQLGLLQPAPRARRRADRPAAGPRRRRRLDRRRRRRVPARLLRPRGRAAFYDAARNIYLEEPHGEDGFWRACRARCRRSAVRLGQPATTLVPIAFTKHVERALPGARAPRARLRPRPAARAPAGTHDAIARFLR